jgi:SPP1 gp7 family putative phage head morphogenesis protein
LPYKELDPAKDIPWNMKKINAETLQGILQGESMDKIAKRLRNVQEMNKTQAIRSARTIVTGAENKGRQDSYARAEADGIILQKEWLATNDGRTRHSHAVLDGAIVDQDKKFDNGLMYPGDPSGRPEEVYNCRCTVAAVVKGFGKKKSIGLPNEMLDEPIPQAKMEQKTKIKTESKPKTQAKTPTTIKTNYTAKELEAKSRKELEKIAREVAKKNAGSHNLTEQEALRRFDLLVSSNTTPQLRKYIKKYGGK